MENDRTSLPAWLKAYRPRAARQISTGEPCLIILKGTRVAWVQFCRLTHKHSHGWWAYSANDFEEERGDSD